MQPNEITEVLNRSLSQGLLARDLTRLAYVAKDGTPRSIPIAFTWNGSQLVMCTSTNAPKLPALRKNPAVALTIDTEVHPPKILLIRGRAELDVVDGIPEEYLEMNGTYQMTPEQRVEGEAEVRSLYDGMVRIVVTPTWAKLIDFETTLPSAVEELVRQRDERQGRGWAPPPSAPGRTGGGSRSGSIASWRTICVTTSMICTSARQSSIGLPWLSWKIVLRSATAPAQQARAPAAALGADLVAPPGRQCHPDGDVARDVAEGVLGAGGRHACSVPAGAGGAHRRA